jgi:two-component system, NarL family, invasion response regulator UvrY
MDVIRVVVADDQLPFRRAARAVLGALPDFELVAEVASGEEAVDVATSLEPELVLMDIHMEGIGGLEATRRIVAERPDAVVVLVSSYRAEELAGAITESGAAAFLPKEQFGAAALKDLWSSLARLRAPRGTRGQPSRDG